MRINLLLRAATLAAVALGFSTPAVAELTRVNDSGFVSRHEVVVEASPKDVWFALITPSGWWRKDHTWSGDSANLTLTPQAGGCFCETIPEVDEPGRFTLQGSVEHMRVIQAYPETALRLQGALGPLQSEPVVGVLTIAISKGEQGTRIVWEYNVGGPMRYEVPVISKAVDGVMGAQLAALGKLLSVVVVPQDEAPDAGGGNAAEAEAETSVPGKASAPIIKVAPTIKAEPLLPPSVKSATGTATVPVTPAASGPAPKLEAKPVPKPAPKPSPKPASVDDAFGDLEGDKPGR